MRRFWDFLVYGIVVGGIYARDVVANEILPLFGVNEGGKSGR